MAAGARRRVLVAACAVMAAAVCIEVGASVFPGPDLDETVVEQAIADLITDPDSPRPTARDLRTMHDQAPPSPGLAIPALALLDAMLLFLAFAMVSTRLRGRAQVIATTVLAVLVLIASVLVFMVGLGSFSVMLALFLSAPFGTLAYIAIWGFFARTAASATLGLLMTLQIAFGVCLLVADPRLPTRNKGLVLLVLTGLLATGVIGFLHGVVPGVLVSIADAVAAMITAALAGVWALIYAVRSLLALPSS